MLQIGGIVYFIWIILAIVLLVAGGYLLKDVEKEKQLRLLFGMTIFAWVIHFARVWLDPDMMPHELLFEDLCGFNTMLYPFLFKMKNRVLKDIMYLVGAVFASHSLFYPNNIDGNAILYYDTIRFFMAHFILVAVPLWLIAWGHHTPSVKSVPYAFLYVLIGALYSFTLSVVIYEVGLVHYYKNYMGLFGGRDSVYELFEAVAPFFRYDTTVGGEVVSEPIPYLYMIPGLFLFYVPVWLAMTLPFQKRLKASN